MRKYLNLLCIILVVFLCVEVSSATFAISDNSISFDNTVIDVFDVVTVTENVEINTIDNFVVLDDGSFAVVCDNQYVFYYSFDMSLIYCLRLRSPSGVTFVEQSKNRGDFIVITSRFDRGYVLELNNHTVYLNKIDTVDLKYDREKWANTGPVEIEFEDLTYILNSSQHFIVTDINGNIILELIGSNSSINIKFVILSATVLVLFFVFFIRHYKNHKTICDIKR